MSATRFILIMTQYLSPYSSSSNLLSPSLPPSLFSLSLSLSLSQNKSTCALFSNAGVSTVLFCDRLCTISHTESTPQPRLCQTILQVGYLSPISHDCIMIEVMLVHCLSPPLLKQMSGFSRCLFSSIRDVTLIQQDPPPPVISLKRSGLLVSALRSKMRDEAALSPAPTHDSTSSRFRKVSDMMLQAGRADSDVTLLQRGSVHHSEADWQTNLPKNVAVAVTSELGETLALTTQVRTGVLAQTTSSSE